MNFKIPEIFVVFIEFQITPVSWEMKKADLAAKNRAEKLGGRLTERWSSLAYVRKMVTEIRSKGIARWHESETETQEIN